MRSICNLHNGIVLRTPSLLSLAIIWSKCVPRNSPTVQFGATKTQSFTHFKLAIMLKLIEFKFIRPYTYLWARKTTVRWPTQQRYPQVVVYKALCDVLRKALEKKAKFYKKRNKGKRKREKKRSNVLDSTVTMINVDHNYPHSHFTLQNEIVFLWHELKIRMLLFFAHR